MPTINRSPQESGDDAWFADGNASIGLLFAGGAVGYFDGTYKEIHDFYRFPNVTIDWRGVIDAADVEFSTWLGGANTVVNLRFRMHDDDDSVAPNTWAEADGRTLTAAFSDWDNVPTETTGDTINSDDGVPSLVAPVQEVVVRSGWSNGNAMTLFVKDNGSDKVTDHTRAWTLWDDATGTDAPDLQITWHSAIAAKVDYYKRRRTA